MQSFNLPLFRGGRGIQDHGPILSQQMLGAISVYIIIITPIHMVAMHGVAHYRFLLQTDNSLSAS